jgi:hypothetical protein
MSISKILTQNGIHFVPKKNTQQNTRYFIYISLAVMAMPLIYLMGTPQVNIQNVLTMYIGVIFVLGMMTYFVKYELDTRALFIGEKGIVLTSYISVMGVYREIASHSFEVKWPMVKSVEFINSSLLIISTTRDDLRKIHVGTWELKKGQENNLSKIRLHFSSNISYQNNSDLMQVIKYYQATKIIIDESKTL